MQIGQILKEARIERGLTLSQVADELLIQEKYLQALEEGNYEQIPGEAYQRAFFRAYADFLGLGEYIENLTHPSAYSNEEEEVTIEDVFGGTWDTSRWARTLGKVAAIVVVIFLVVYGAKAAMNTPREQEPEPPRVDSTQAIDVITEPSERSWRWPEPDEIIDPISVLGDLELELKLTAIGECWVEVDTRNATLFSNTMYAGDVRIFNDIVGFAIRAGKPEKLFVEFRGEDVPWEPGQTIMILPEGAAILVEADDPPPEALP